MTRIDIERTELRAFTSGVHAEAARNLEFLCAIETTLDWLALMTRIFNANAEFAERTNGGLGHIEGVVDPDGSLQGALQDAQEAIEQVYRRLIEKRQCARGDRQLTHEDGIEAGYTEAIAAAADLYNAINRLRWNVGENDFDAQPRQLSRPYAADNIDQMFDDLLAS